MKIVLIRCEYETQFTDRKRKRPESLIPHEQIWYDMVNVTTCNLNMKRVRMEVIFSVEIILE